VAKRGDDFETRRNARSGWPVRSYRTGQEPGDDISGDTTPEERLAMVWPLTLEAWRVAGRSLPDYDRAHMPARFFRPGERPPEDDD
jgi:hypothetical protein